MTQTYGRGLSQLMSPWFRIADDWANLPNDCDQECRVRARAVFTLGVIFLAPAIMLPAVTQFTAYAGMIAFATAMPAGLGVAASLIVLRYSDDPRKAGFVFCAPVTLALATWPIAEAGLFSPNQLLLTVSPLIWGLMISARACLIYTAALIAYIGFLIAFAPEPMALPTDAPISTRIYLGLVLIVGAFAAGVGTAGYGLMTNNVLGQLQRETRRASRLAKSADEARRTAEAATRRFQMFTDIASDWLWEVDADGRIVAFGGRDMAVLGGAAGELQGAHFLSVLDFREADASRMKQALRNREGYSSIPARYTVGDDRELILELSAKPNFDETGGFLGYVGVAKDVTDRIRAENDVRFLAENDKLTGLANRHTFTTRIEDELDATSGVGAALFAIDLDDFKSVNDSYGHHIGDALLVEVAARISSCIRKDDWAARLGGDEFVVVSMGHDPKRWDVQIVADRILDRLSEPYRIEELELHVSASIGVAKFPSDATSARKLAKYADMALYAAKEAGRNQWRPFSPAMEQTATQRKLLETGLRRAMERGDLQVWYQPLVNLDSGLVTGFEALARWVDGQRGYVPPPLFIDVAEKCGLISDLGAYVLRRACADAAAWETPDGETPPRVSVNISAVQFADGGLPDAVAEVLAETGLDPQRLELEITESILMEDTNNALQVLEGLERLGVAVAIDDFGTGYSSLSYLKRFPLSRLKVDRSFIHDLETDENDRTITQTVVKLGESLGLAVIAEGVETEGQRVWLEQMGCQEVQGYLFAKPMPVDDVRTYLSDPDSALSRGVLQLPVRKSA